MFHNAEGGQGGAGDGGSDDPEGGQGEGGTGGEGGQGEGGEDKVTFDDKQQKELQRIINQTIAKERAKAEADRKKAEEEAEKRAKMTAEQQVEADRQERERKAQEKEQKANDRIINLEVKDVARELGVPSKKLERFLKLVDRVDLEVDEDGSVDRTKVELAVKAVLADVPEFKGSDNNQGPGEFSGGQGGGAKFTVAQINSMSAEEIKNNYDDVMASMKIHNKN